MSQGDWVEGRARWGQKGRLKAYKCSINACKSHLLLVRGMGWKGRLCFWLGSPDPCLGLCTCLGRDLRFGLGLA